MKFKEMEYERPIKENIINSLKALTEKLEKPASYNEARDLFLQHEKIMDTYETQSTLAHIRHSIDTRDKFYDEEEEFFNQNTPDIEAVNQKWIMALNSSSFKNEFEKEFGELLFKNIEIQLRSFSDKIVEDMKKENSYVTEYEKLLASAQIEFEGEKYTISQMTKFKQDPDDERRLKAWKAEGGWYKENQEKLDNLYDELVKIRTNMAKTLGHENFVKLGYDKMTRNCYNKEDIEIFRQDVITNLVPLADKIYRKQAERLGKTYPLSFCDAALEFRSGNPKPVGTEKDIVETGKRFYEDLSPETAEFFHTMLDGDLMDLSSKPGKQGGGYCTSILDYKVPFIFANFNGTQGDVEVITHEAGHAFAGYVNRDRIPSAYIWPSMESCEVHSMSMEFFAETFAKDFFGEDSDKFLYSHLSGAITFIPYGTMVDHFQHIVYENPDMTPKERHNEWKRLTGIYMPWIKLDGDIPFFADGEAWQRQHHIYSLPFYYIDYCLAQTVALQFWSLIQRDRQEAFKKYMKYTSQGGSKTFVDLLKNAGLVTPFEKGCLGEVCELASEYLDKFDLS